VTDIRLGAETSGWEIGRRARQHNSAIAIVYISGDSAGQYSAEGVPGSVMIQKPFVPDQIVTALSTQLNQIASTPR
jgi:two-component system, OmpR family, response regulator